MQSCDNPHCDETVPINEASRRPMDRPNTDSPFRPPDCVREMTAHEIIHERILDLEMEAAGLRKLVKSLPAELPHAADRALVVLLRRPRR